MQALGKQIEVKTIEGILGNGFDVTLNRYLKEGWKVMSAPVLISGRIVIQQVYRDINYKSDFKKAVDLLVEYNNCRTNKQLIDIRERSHKFVVKIKNNN